MTDRDLRLLALGQPGLSESDDDDDLGPCRGIAVATAIMLPVGLVIWVVFFAIVKWCL